LENNKKGCQLASFCAAERFEIMLKQFGSVFLCINELKRSYKIKKMESDEGKRKRINN